MNTILIFGAGSIGNHMAFAARKLKSDVYLTDINPLALKRMKKEIYPNRYKNWDKKIRFIDFKKVFNQKINFDLIIVGTPPNTHIKLFKKCFKKLIFKKILIEKPLCVYNENNFKDLNKLLKKKMIFCGYNHSISNAYHYFSNLIDKKFKNIEYLDVNWNEGWQGILKAHFWIKNEFQSYLGNIKDGGGALHEHSHGLHLFQLILDKFKLKIKNFKKNVIINFKKKGEKKYDNYTHMTLSKPNQILKYTTDLISYPAEKKILIKKGCYKATLEFNHKYNTDNVSFFKNNKLLTSKNFKKTRSSEFEGELKHILKIQNVKKFSNSNINVITGIKTIKLIKSILKNV